MAHPETEQRVRVVICDDAVGFPGLIWSWLAEAAGVEPVALAKSATELLDVVGDLAPDVVLLDLMLPEGPTSPELVAQVRGLAPTTRIILVSSLPPALLADEARRTGVDGWCPKATTPDDLRAVVTAVA